MNRVLGLIALSTIVLATHASAQTMYATGNDGSSLVKLNVATGVGSVVGSFGYQQVYAGSFTADGQFWTIVNGFSNAQLAKVDLNTGHATTVAPIFPGSPVIDLQGIGNDLFAAAYDGRLFKVNQTTGALSVVGNMGFSSVMDLAATSDGRLFGLNGSQIWSINTTTGAGSFFMNWVAGDSPMSMAFVDDKHLIVNAYEPNSRMWNLDMDTKSAAFVGYTGINYVHGGDIAVTATPEPASMILMATGLFGVAVVVRRRRGKAV